MSEIIKELRDKVLNCNADIQTLLKKPRDEGRDRNADEEKRFDELHNEFVKLTKDLDRELRAKEVADKAKELDELEPRGDVVQTHGVVIETAEEKRDKEKQAKLTELRAGLWKIAGMPAHREEERALQANLDISGGFTVNPQQFESFIIKGVDDEQYIRQFATIRTVPDAESLGTPKRDARLNTMAYVADELTAGSADTALIYGKREFRPHPMAGYILVSKELLRVSTVNIEQEVMGELAYDARDTEETAFMEGTGSQQPLGLFVSSSSGISSSRDVSTGNTTSEIKYAGLVEALYSLKPQYINSSSTRWLFHRDAIKQIHKLVDGDGRPLLQPDVQGGRAMTILGKPYIMSEYVPNTFTAGLYVGLIGDLRWYWIVDSMTATVEVAKEHWITTNQTGFFMRLKNDGMPVLEEAFARVTLGT